MAELASFYLHPGDPAPPFELRGTDGKVYRLGDFASHRLLAVVFWCNHCPYVQAWEGRMVEIGQRYGPRGLAVVLINSNDTTAYPQDRFEAMAERARDHHYPFPYLFDESQSVAKAYGALVTPHPMLFGPDRRLLFQGAIDDNHERRERVEHHYLEAAIESALAGKPIANAELPVRGCSVKWKA
jgi:peroxiredoxin